MANIGRVDSDAWLIIVSTSGKGRSLNLKQYRKLVRGAGRWMIEINGFKQMNQLFSSKKKPMWCIPAVYEKKLWPFCSIYC